MTIGVTDITGQKFGRLTVTGFSHREMRSINNYKYFWFCDCECGTKNVLSERGSLKNGSKKSCGCLTKRTTVEEFKDQSIIKSKKIFKDITGEKFGKLTVVELSHRKDGKRVSRFYWWCVCDCGNQNRILASSNNLWSGHVQSCGCIVKDKESKFYYDCDKLVDKDLAYCVSRLYNSYKKSAENRGLLFAITKNDILNYVQEPCFYCGTIGSNKLKRPRRNAIVYYNGIDRKDSAKGYEEGNMVTCCKTCNYAKSDMTIDEFYKWIDNLITFQNKRWSNQTVE